MEFKIGDKAYDIIKGWGVVTNIFKYTGYPFEVDIGNETFTYSEDGFLLKSDKRQRLYKTEPTIINNDLQEG